MRGQCSPEVRDQQLAGSSVRLQEDQGHGTPGMLQNRAYLSCPPEQRCSPRGSGSFSLSAFIFARPVANICAESPSLLIFLIASETAKGSWGLRLVTITCLSVGILGSPGESASGRRGPEEHGSSLVTSGKHAGAALHAVSLLLGIYFALRTMEGPQVDPFWQLRGRLSSGG